jgi:hypothetical protein
MVRRKAILGLILLIAATGCNAGTSGGLKRSEPPVAKELLSKARVIDQQNKNAATIQSLKATPSIVFSGEDDRGRKNGGKLSGRMAMERDKDFRLEMLAFANKQADIGSNAKGFWFWVKDGPMYTCDYANANANPMAVTMQPDWIIESMGLREISEREAATINATKGDKPGQLILTQLRNDPKGGSLTKVTIVDELSGEILEHRLYSGAKEKLLAQATIGQTQHIEMEGTGENPKRSVVSFPAKIRLEWFVEKFSLDITMSGLTINPDFPPKQQAFLFTEPTIAGAVHIDLAKLGTNPPASASSSRIYESAPRGVRLGNPEVEPFGSEGASLTPSGNNPPTLAADLPPLPSGYIGPQVPRAPDSETVQTSASQGSFRGTFRQ